jgi:hypothetical protein
MTNTSLDTFTEEVMFVVTTTVVLPKIIPPEQFVSDKAVTVKLVVEYVVMACDEGLEWLVVITPSDQVTIQGDTPVSEASSVIVPPLQIIFVPLRVAVGSGWIVTDTQLGVDVQPPAMVTTQYSPELVACALEID